MQMFDGHSRFILQQVKDTIEVDQNVTRHLGDELGRDDWNLLVSIVFFSF